MKYELSSAYLTKRFTYFHWGYFHIRIRLDQRALDIYALNSLRQTIYCIVTVFVIYSFIHLEDKTFMNLKKKKIELYYRWCKKKNTGRVLMLISNSLSILFFQCVYVSSGKKFKYKKLCICTGAVPKVIAEDSPYVMWIRDTESVCQFQARMKGARRILNVGNGGIATEMVYEVTGELVVRVLCEVLD